MTTLSTGPEPGVEPDEEYLEGAIERLAERCERLVFSIPETARMLGVSRALAYELARRGELPTMRSGRRRVVPRPALVSMLAGGPKDAA
jgi:excisionase family DNA binding protein